MCTEFILPKTTEKRISGRTLDFDDTFSHWALSGIPAGTTIKAFALGKEQNENGESIPKAFSWNAKYGCVGIGLKLCKKGIMVLDPQYRIADGLNEAGLSAAALWLPGSVFPKASDRTAGSQLLSCFDIVSWAMTNYASAKELHMDLERIRLRYENPELKDPEAKDLPSFWNPLQYNLGEIFPNLIGESLEWENLMPLHYQFHDKEGYSLVLEFRDGKMELTDNTNLGVITNNPFLDWHLTNLGNYLSVTNLDTEEREIVGRSVKTTGDGGSTVGLPGSPLPSARFIRASYLLDFAKFWLAKETTTDQQARAYAFNLLGNVSVPRTMANQPHLPEPLEDYTQVALVRDHKDPELFIRTGYGIGTWSVKIKETLNANPLFCIDLENLDHGVTYPIDLAKTVTCKE